MDPGVAAGAAVAVQCPRGDGSTPMPGLAQFFFSKKGKNTSNSGVVFHWSNGSCLANLSSATQSSKENVFAACVLHWEQVLSHEMN